MKEFLRGELIFKKGDLCDFIAIIKRGAIIKKGIINSEIINQNEIIGINLLFSSNPFFDSNYYSQALTTIQIITKNEILNNTNTYLNKLADSYHKLLIHNNILLEKNPYLKLCKFLYNEYIKTNSTTFLLKQTKHELANYLAINKNQLTIELQNLIKNNIIANQNKLYTIINIDKLIKEIKEDS